MLKGKALEVQMFLSKHITYARILIASIIYRSQEWVFCIDYMFAILGLGFSWVLKRGPSGLQENLMGRSHGVNKTKEVTSHKELVKRSSLRSQAKLFLFLLNTNTHRSKSLTP